MRPKRRRIYLPSGQPHSEPIPPEDRPAPVSSTSTSTFTSTMASSSARPAPATKRLLNEMRELEHEPNPNLLRFGPVSDNELMHWEAVMKGVPGTAYEAGLWKLDIKIPDNYPNVPPEVKFVTPCCHPNVDFSTGAICLDLFKDAWHVQPLSSVMDAIHRLLAYPEPDSPFNVDVAKLFRDGDLIGAESLIRYYCGEFRYDGR